MSENQEQNQQQEEPTPETLSQGDDLNDFGGADPADEAISKRIGDLEVENRGLRERLARMESSQESTPPAAPIDPAPQPQMEVAEPDISGQSTRAKETDDPDPTEQLQQKMADQEKEMQMLRFFDESGDEITGEMKRFIREGVMEKNLSMEDAYTFALGKQSSVGHAAKGVPTGEETFAAANKRDEEAKKEDSYENLNPEDREKVGAAAISKMAQDGNAISVEI